MFFSYINVITLTLQSTVYRQCGPNMNSALFKWLLRIYYNVTK